MSNKNSLKRLFGVGAFACCSAILLSVTAQSARSQQIPTVNDLGGMIGGTIRFYQSLNDEAEADAVPEAPVQAEAAEAVVVNEAAEVRSLPDFSDPAPVSSSVSVIDEAEEEAKQAPEMTAVLSLNAAEPDQASAAAQTPAEDDWMKEDDAGQTAAAGSTTAAEPEKTASSEADKPSGSGKDGKEPAAAEDKENKEEEKKADDDWMETADDGAEELTAVASGKLSLGIDNARHTEYLHGYEDGTARPGGKITRAEACQILYNLLRTKPSNRASLSDVKNDDWFAEPVRLLAAYSIVDTPGDKARPGDYMTRAELVSALSRLVSAESKGEVSFSDVPASHPYYDAIAKAVGLGWVNGYEDGTFKPDGSITRAEAAKVVNRALSRTPDKDWIDANVKDSLYSDLAKDHWAYYELMEASVAHDVSIKDGTERWNPEKAEEKPAETKPEEKPAEQPAETKPEEEPHKVVQPEASGWADEELERMLSEPLPEEVDASRLEFDGLELYALDEKGKRVKNVTLGRYLTFGKDGRYTSGNEELDKLVKDLLKEITTEDMTREEKLRAAYEYCRDSFQYRRNNFYEPGQTGWEVEEALTMLQKKKGNCYNFAASFTMLARQLGYDAEAVSGLVGSELQAHGWAEIVMDGERLFYDTILESSYKERGFDYDFFGQHYEKAPWPYHKR